MQGIAHFFATTLTLLLAVAPADAQNVEPEIRPHGVQIQLVAGGKIFAATLYDNEAARAFVAKRIKKHLPRFTPEAMAKNQALVDLLRRIAKEKEAAPAQIALAWQLAQKPWIVSISGTTREHRLEENIAAADVALTPADLHAIAETLAAIEITGERYPAHLLATTGVEAPSAGKS